MVSSLVEFVRQTSIGAALEKTDPKKINDAYERARDEFEKIGVDTDLAQTETDEIRIGHPCWAIDSVGGYEPKDPNASKKELSSGGIQPPERKKGGPRNLDEHLKDLCFAMDLVPGPNAALVHNIYADLGETYVERSERTPAHFEKWIQWAKEHKYHLHMNPSPFRHRMAQTGFTISSPDEAIKKYWMAEIKATLIIAEAMGAAQGSECVWNGWFPDGGMDDWVQRHEFRVRLWNNLKEAIQGEYPHVVKAVEGKLFAPGTEDYVVGGHQLYSDFSLANGTLYTIDTGHFNNIVDMGYLADMVGQALVCPDRKGILTHLSFPNKWDCDFVVRLRDWLFQITTAVKRSGREKDVYYGNDYFQPGAHPIAMIALGGRATRQGILYSQLDPLQALCLAEDLGSDMAKLAIDDRRKTLPWGAVWDKYCSDRGVPVGLNLLKEIGGYEMRVMSKRD